MITDVRHDLAEMELAELEQALESMGHPRFHARQVFQWVHKRGVTDFAGMTDLGRELRSALAAAFRSVTPELVRKQILELALQHNLNIVSLQNESNSLEVVFRELTQL